MFIMALTPPPVIDLHLSNVYFWLCTLRGLGTVDVSRRTHGGHEEHEANQAVKELKPDTWDCNNVTWELLNYSVCLLGKKELGVL